MSKRKIFLELRDEIARKPWGLAFETLMDKRRPKEPVERCPVKLLQIIQQLFPTHGPPLLNSIIDSLKSTPVPITTTEIEKLADRLKCGKAPGADGIPAEAVKVAMRMFARVFQKVFHNILTTGQFPSVWKKQLLVLIPKPGKTPGNLSALRPLGLIDVLVKALEMVILDRLTPYTEGEHGLSDDHLSGGHCR